MSEQSIVETESALESGAWSKAHARQVVDLVREKLRSAGDHLHQARADYEDAQELYDQAYKGRAWIPLGYESFEAMAKAEFGQARIWQSQQERDERILAFREAGWSDRGIGSLLGVGKGTIYRAGLAGAPDGAPAKRDGGEDTSEGGTNVPAAKGVNSGDVSRSVAKSAPAPSAALVASVPRESRGLDGKSYRKAAPLERVDRIVEATRLHEQGWSQQQIAEEISERTGETVSQRTISEDLKVSRQWSDSLDEPDRERFASGDLPSEELTAKAQIEIVAPKGPDLFVLAGHGMRDLKAALDFLRDEVVERDEWLDQQHKVSEGLGSAALTSMMRPASWLAKDVDYTGFRPEILEAALASMEEIQRCLDQARELAEAAREAAGEAGMAVTG